MSYSNEVFERLNVQSICEFILHGADYCTDERSSKEQIEHAKKAMTEALCAAFPDMLEREHMIDKIYSVVSASEAVYMELGLQAGIILAFQILTNNEKSIF